MPGLSVAFGDGGTDGTLRRALEATTAFDHYDASTARVGEQVAIGRTEYDGYPIQRVDTDSAAAVLEGRIYDDVDEDAALERVASLVATDDVEGLREWVGTRDGDYLVAVADGDAVSVLNDPFARLPAYYATIDGTTVLSRELSVLREVARRRDEPLALDRLAIGQLLAFGYPLGTRTPFDGVRTVPPGSLLSIDGDGDVDVTSLYEHDFETCEHADRSLEANADELADRIATACRRRTTPDRQTVVSLSGGLDSRTVAAAYAGKNEPPAQAGANEREPAPDEGGAEATEGPQPDPPIATTFQREDHRNADEVAAAGAVARRLGLDWSVYTAASSPDRRETLLRTKLGTNFLGMAFILDFFEQLRDRYGTTTYVTGDGGDKLLVGLEPAATPDALGDLVEHVIAANSRLPLDEAAAIANVDPDAIRASVARRLESYPESDLARRYVHFLLRERGINFLLQGEDRNRYYAWTVAPFYALPVFEYAMNCPDEQKAYRRLQSAILERFDPGLVDLPYPNFGAPVSTRRYRAKQFVYDALERYPSVRDRVVDLVTADTALRGPIVEEIRADRPGLERAGLSPAATADVLATPEQYSGIQLELLATVTALAGEVVEDARAAERDASDGRESPPGADQRTDPPRDEPTADESPADDGASDHTVASSVGDTNPTGTPDTSGARIDR